MYVLQLMNYAAPYKGNFIESLEQIEKQSNGEIKNVYLFCKEADESSKIWIDKMRSTHKPVYFMSNSDRRNYRIIKQLINQYNIEVIHMHFYGIRVHTLVNFAKLGMKIKLVRHFHNHSDYCNHAIKRIYGRIFYKNAIMVGCSESVSESICRDFPREKVCTVNNAIDFERLNYYEDVLLRQNSEKPTIMMLGFDYKRKGVDLAVEAIAKLRECKKYFELFIVFSAFVEENIKKLKEQLKCDMLPEWIHILPPRNDIASYYNNVDIFISPSREEGFCYAIPEAAWCGCTIVASEIGGQTFHKGIPHVFWCEQNNSKALMEALMLAKEDHNSISEKKQTREYLVRNYSVQKWARDIIDLYK